ncbi:unnamed protein product [Rhodiola kirilowii]
MQGRRSTWGSSNRTGARNENLSSSNADSNSQNPNPNFEAFWNSSEQVQFTEPGNSNRSGFQGSGQRPVGSANSSFVTPGNVRVSPKRKFMGEDIGQSSVGGSSRSYQHGEGSSLNPIPVDISESSLDYTSNLYARWCSQPSGVVIGEQGDMQIAEAARRMSRALLDKYMSSQPVLSPARVPAPAINSEFRWRVVIPAIESGLATARNIRFFPPAFQLPDYYEISDEESDDTSTRNDQPLPVPVAASSRQPVSALAVNRQRNQPLSMPGAAASLAALGINVPRRRMVFAVQSRGNVDGAPNSSRSHSAARGESSRQIAEAASVLERMREGGPLQAQGTAMVDESEESDESEETMLDQAEESEEFEVAEEADDVHNDMRLDVDNMTYEELLQLEEQIGNVNTGLTEATVKKCVKQRQSRPRKDKIEPCCICKDEYQKGQKIGTLKCGHVFHPGCIKEWLLVKNSCPICKSAPSTSK